MAAVVEIFSALDDSLDVDGLPYFVRMDEAKDQYRSLVSVLLRLLGDKRIVNPGTSMLF